MANETKSKTVKVRLKHGRMLIARGVEGAPDKFAEAGDIVEVDRVWAERLLHRAFDGYPPPTSGPLSGQPGAAPGLVLDSPIELVG